MSRQMRTPASGPSNGMPAAISAAEAPMIEMTSGWLIWSAERTVAMTWTSLRNPSANDERIGRSIMRAVSVAFSDGRDSRLMKPPGSLPAAYMRSSKSTVSGKKSRSLGNFDAVAVTSTIGLALTNEDGATGLLGQLAGLEHVLLAVELERFNYLGHEASLFFPLPHRAPHAPRPSPLASLRFLSRPRSVSTRHRERVWRREDVPAPTTRRREVAPRLPGLYLVVTRESPAGR